MPENGPKKVENLEIHETRRRVRSDSDFDDTFSSGPAASPCPVAQDLPVQSRQLQWGELSDLCPERPLFCPRRTRRAFVSSPANNPCPGAQDLPVQSRQLQWRGLSDSCPERPLPCPGRTRRAISSSPADNPCQGARICLCIRGNCSGAGSQTCVPREGKRLKIQESMKRKGGCAQIPISTTPTLSLRSSKKSDKKSERDVLEWCS